MEEIAKRGVAPVSLTGTTWSEACSCSDQCANSRENIRKRFLAVFSYRIFPEVPMKGRASLIV